MAVGPFKMKTVLLLGAGVTRAARPTTAIKRRAPLDADFFAIASRVKKKKTVEVIECLQSLVGDYADSLKNSLETASTYLYIKAIDSKPGSPYHVGFLNLLSLLGDVLAETTNSIPVGPRTLVYRFLLSELRRLEHPEDLSIVTFNYDLLLERVLDSIAVHGHSGAFVFPGCYRISALAGANIAGIKGHPKFTTSGSDLVGVSLLKLHGSMNWQSTHTSSRPTPHALLNANRALNVIDSPTITSLSWRRDQRTVHLKPIIVPPVSGKRGMMQRDVVALWSTAGKALQESDRVVVAGYSCPPLDLEARILISENMRANTKKKVYVIDPNPAAAVKFLELCGVDHITVYTSISDWVRDAR